MIGTDRLEYADLLMKVNRLEVELSGRDLRLKQLERRVTELEQLLQQRRPRPVVPDPLFQGCTQGEWQSDPLRGA